MKLKKFSDWKVFYKIVALSLAILVTIFALFFIFIIPVISESLYHNKQENVKHTVEVAYNILDNFHKMAKNGEISEDEAKSKAVSLISDLRYNENEYFWINNYSGKMIMHPINTALNGKDMSDYKDPDGVFVFVKMTEVAKREGSGYIEYRWNKQGMNTPSPKISFVKGLKEWEWIVGSGIYVDDVEEEIAGIKFEFTIILLLTSIGAMIISFFVAKKISEPIKKLDIAAEKFASGDYNVSVDIESKDEIGKLSNAFNQMVETISMQLSYLEKIPTPVMVIDKDFNIKFMNKAGSEVVGKEQKSLVGKKCYDQFKTGHCQSEKCALAQAMKYDRVVTEETIAKPNGKELPIMYTGTNIKDKSGQIIGALEYVADITELKNRENYLVRNTDIILKAMENFSNGDLEINIKPENENDSIGQLFKGFNKAVENIKSMILQVMQAVHSTASASAQISSSAEEMAAGAQEQSSQTTEIAGAVEQMTKTIMETSRNATVAAEQSKLAKEVANNGGKSIQQTIEGMNKIAMVVSEAAETIKELGKSSEKIGTIIEVIDDIADQTNLLALNAAIEAARAGEHGRGFAVVADEVRKLAERTTKATKEISDMIKEIQRDTNGAVVAMEGGTTEVEKGKKLANESGESLKQILDKTTEVMDIINQVAAASEEQSSAAEQISHSIEGINNVTQQTATGVQEIAKAAEDLNNLTTTLQNLIQKFKIENQSSKIDYNKKYLRLMN